MKHLITNFKITAVTIVIAMMGFVQNANAVNETKTVGTTGGEFATLKGAFDAINAGTLTGDVVLQIVDNTTETATARLATAGTITSFTTNGGSGYQAPVISVTGGTNTALGTITTTITNGVITSITNTVGGNWTVVPTSVTIADPVSGTTATATCALFGTAPKQLAFTITNGGTGYGPTVSFSGGGGGTGASIIPVMTTTATTLNATPAPVGLTFPLSTISHGKGYTSIPTATISGNATVVADGFFSACSYSSVTIYPTSSGKSITGDINLINLDGADNVTIDGRVNQTGAADLIINSTATAASNIVVDNEAQNNKIKYCILKSVAVTLGGTVGNVYLGRNGANNNNEIDYNTFTNRSIYAVCGNGNASTPSSGNKIRNNNFADCFATGIATTNTTANIYIAGGAVGAPLSSGWTITGNSFYETTVLTPTTGNVTMNFIQLGSSSTTVVGAGNTISGNYIGGTDAQCGAGTGNGVFTKTNGTLSKYNFGTGILMYLDNGGTNTVYNNTFKNIDWSNHVGAASANFTFIGIDLQNGNADITYNTVGGNSTAGSITYTHTGANGNASLLGIRVNSIASATPGTVNCDYNTIGSMVFNNNATSNKQGYVIAIQNGANSAGTVNIRNNSIGSETAAYGISLSNSVANTGAQQVTGIANICSVANACNISNNTIANLNNTCASVLGYTAGINSTGGTANNNTIHDLVGSNLNINAPDAAAGAVNSVSGIYFTGTHSNQTANGNLIYNLSNTATTPTVLYVIGINWGIQTGNSMVHTCSGNFIRNLSVNSANTSAVLVGVHTGRGVFTASNNIITLGGNTANNIYGIWEYGGTQTAAQNVTLYHNTIYISGTTPNSSTQNSFCFNSTSITNTKTFNNNIFFNGRLNGTNATGVHRALRVGTVDAKLVSNYNNIYTSSGTNAVLANATTYNTWTAWSAQRDANGNGIDPLFANPTGTAAVDFIPSPSVALVGTNLFSLVATDYKGAPRPASPTAPRMGAYEAGFINAATNASTLTTGASYTLLSGNVLTVDNDKTLFNLTIQPGAKLTNNVSSKTLTVTNFKLNSDATGNATYVENGGTLAATTATVEQYLGSARNWYLTPSTTTAAVPTGQTYYEYNETAATWTSLPATTALTAGKGYIAQPSAVSTLSYTGTLNTGSVPVALTRNSNNNSTSGYNLIANPYPSYLNAMEAINNTANVQKTIWYRTRSAAGTYHFETVNTTSGVGTNAAATGTVTGYVPPMQAFWVRTSTDENEIVFTNAMRAHAHNVLLTDGETEVPTTPLKAKAIGKGILRLQIANNDIKDEVVIYFNANATNGLDDYDSQKRFNNTASIPEIYTQIGTAKLSINGMSDVPYDTEIPLGFVSNKVSDLSISATEMKNFEIGTKLFIKDKLLNIETEISGETGYNFSAAITPATTDRFSLLFRAPGNSTGINSAVLKAQVFVNAQNQIAIIAPEECTYSIYNAMGQKVTEGITTSNRTYVANFGTGIYIVKLNDNGRKLTSKVIIK